MLKEIRQAKPAIQVVSNLVTANDCANALIACGASPTMAHAPEEIGDMAKVCQAFVGNLGATENYPVIAQALPAYAGQAKSCVIDPVGVGASPFRRDFFHQLPQGTVTAVRGNLTEIKALADQAPSPKREGKRVPPAVVDANQGDRDLHRPEALARAVKACQALHDQTGAIIIASGSEDLVMDGDQAYLVENGSAWMEEITGAGCMASAVLGAFLALDPTLSGALQATLFMAQAGELAGQAMKEGEGPGTFHIRFLDAIYALSKDQASIPARISKL